MAEAIGKDAPSSGRSGLIISALIVAEAVSSFEFAMTLVAMPAFMKIFHASAADVGWISTAYLIVAAAISPIAGRLGDMFGLKRVLIAVIVLSMTGSLVSFFSAELSGVIVGRAIQGAAGAIFPLALAIAKDSLPENRSHMGVALLSGTAFLASAVGSLLAGVLLDVGGWRYLFIAALGLAVVSLVCIAFAIPGRSRLTRFVRVDWIGAVLFIFAIFMLLGGMTQVPRWGWGNQKTVELLVGGAVLLMLWVWWESRVSDPLVHLNLLLGRKVGLTMFGTALLYLGPAGALSVVQPMVLQLPTTFPVGFGQSASVTGTVGFAASILAFALSPVAGYLSRKLHPRNVLVIGSGIALACFMSLFWAVNSMAAFIGVCMTAGIGISLVIASTPNLLMDDLSPKAVGEISGLYQVARTLFLSTGTAVATLLLSVWTVPGTKVAGRTAFNVTFGLIVLATAACFVVFYLTLSGADGRRRVGSSAQIKAGEGKASSV